MKRKEYTYLAILLLCIALLIYSYHLHAYIVLLLSGVSVTILWEYMEQKKLSMQRKEHIELQEEIKSTAKDAHLKNKQLLTVVTSIPFPMLLVDQFGNIVMHNNIRELCEEGMQMERMTYMNNSYVHPVREFIKDAFILEKPMDKIIKINGVEYQSISIPVLAKKKYSGCLVLFQDISKTLEGEKMQKRFIADASHELKTPIAVIKGMVEILNRDDFDDEATRKEFMGQIEQEINRLDALVKDLLQLSRLSLSTVLLERKKTDFCAICERAIHSLQESAKEKNLCVTTDFQSRDLVFCDPMKMSQVVLNLLSNAIKYSDDGTIELRTRQEGSWFVFEIQDEGCGIRQQDLEKIFERFYRVDNGRSRHSGGSGLGLSIVKSIVEAHSGKIEVQSELHKGTQFTIRLKN